MINIGKPELTMTDFYENPVWYYDEEAELYFQVLSMDEKVTSIDHFRFRTEFTTAAGDALEGCVSGLGDVAISFFANGRWYSANVDWPDASCAQIEALIDDSAGISARTVEQFFPVQFRTVINKPPYIDRAGGFDL